jgi:hypothetical protein
MKGVNMVLSPALIDPVKQYQKQRMYAAISQAANELIRIGLEQEAKK